MLLLRLFDRRTSGKQEIEERILVRASVAVVGEDDGEDDDEGSCGRGLL